MEDWEVRILDEDDPNTPVWRGYLEAFDDLLRARNQVDDDAASKRMQMIADVGLDFAGFTRRRPRAPREARPDA